MLQPNESSLNDHERFKILLARLKNLPVDLLQGEAYRDILDQCLAFVEHSFPNMRQELLRKIAFSVFNNVNIPANLLRFERSLAITFIRNCVFFPRAN